MLVDEETGEALTEAEVEEFVDFFLENYEHDEETLEEMKMPSKSGKQSKAHVFLSGAGALGIEIAKNIVLAGCKSFVLHDD